MTRYLSLLCWLFASSILMSEAQAENSTSQFKSWQEKVRVEKMAINSQNSTKSLSKIYTTDVNQLRALLLNENLNENLNESDSQSDSHVISIPLPNGQLVNFVLTPSRIMAYELAQKYPDIKTFTGSQVDKPNNSGRFDITPNGFHGMFYYDGELIFIEPELSLTRRERASDKGGDKRGKKRVLTRKFSQYDHYQSYVGKKAQLTKAQLTSKGKYKFHQPKKTAKTKIADITKLMAAKSAVNQSRIKTYRLAISAAAEYTQFNGGTVDSAMAEIVTLVNRLNEVYQRDLAIKLELVANNDLLIFTDANEDPFDNTSDDGEVNTGVIDGLIGNGNYDIGHVVNTNGGGLAVLGAVCDPDNKGDGITGMYNPVNDAFYIDYVAHEIGHQFGADHTFNGTSGACEGNRSADSAYEVGSGSTIMAYAGICEDQNIQSASDAFFHTKSIDDIKNYIQHGTGNTCGAVTGKPNKVAIVDAGIDYTIPAHTPFILTGSATDVDSAELTYSWQQFDLGAASASRAEQVDDGFRPLFRAWSPTGNGDRILPTLNSILTNSISLGETLPTTDRELNFRLLVRDDEGGVSFDANKITVVNTGEAFAVSSPLLNDTWQNNDQHISWQVAQTQNPPINCAAVDILLSIDGGHHFTHPLAKNSVNNGSREISLSAYCAKDINTHKARIKVACSNNIFFAINKGDFSIDKKATAEDIAITKQQVLSINQGDNLTITRNLFTYHCDTPTSLTIVEGDNYSVSDNTITPRSDFFGHLNVGVITHNNTLSSNAISSEIKTIIVSVIEKAEAVPEADPKQNKKSSGSIFWLLTAILVIFWRNINTINRA
ncbi:MAG: hypothetical protein JJV99_06565 [Colwellia sp.]|nr:hypothetical protein [Colwellia sp.]